MVKKLNKIVKDKEHVEPFEFHNQGSLAYVGDWYATFAVVSLNPDVESFSFSGKPFMIGPVRKI